MAVGGLLCNSLVVGVFPPLLILASRRKGDLVPGVVLRWLSNPAVVGGIYLGFVGILLLHAVAIWSGPWERMAAAAVAVVALVGTIAIVRSGAFVRRTVVGVSFPVGSRTAVLQVADSGVTVPLLVTLTFTGEPPRAVQGGSVELAESDKLQSVRCELPPSPSRELKLWAAPPPANDPSIVRISGATFRETDASIELDVKVGVILPRSGRAGVLTLKFAPVSEEAEPR
jgi:hypothetical protein